MYIFIYVYVLKPQRISVGGLLSSGVAYIGVYLLMRAACLLSERFSEDDCGYGIGWPCSNGRRPSGKNSSPKKASMMRHCSQAMESTTRWGQPLPTQGLCCAVEAIWRSDCPFGKMFRCGDSKPESCLPCSCTIFPIKILLIGLEVAAWS